MSAQNLIASIPLPADVVERLLKAALDARQHAHAPYSNFPVGAALLGESGRVYLGSNVENASYGLSVCAERSAVFAAVAAGEKKFRALAVATDTDEPTPPCGACRQILREFVEDLPVYLAGRQKTRETTLKALLPDPFVPPSLPGTPRA